MSIKLLIKTTSLLFIIVILSAAIPLSADNAILPDEIINSVIDYHIKNSDSASAQDWLDGALSADSGLGSQWLIMALAQSGNRLSFDKYESVLTSYLNDNDIASLTTRQRCALTLISINPDNKNNPYVIATADDTAEENGIMPLIFGLHLLNNGVISDKAETDDIITKILSMQLDDGGWALRGEISDVDVTAMTLQAISRYCDASEKYDNIDKSINTAIQYLSSVQCADGGFISFGVENAESSAQVVIALSSLGVDADFDERFIKNGISALDALISYYNPDGYFSHTADGKNNGEYGYAATYQSLSALISVGRMNNGLSPFYIFDTDNSTEPAETKSDDDTKTDTGDTKVNTDIKTPDRVFIISDYKLWTSVAIATIAILTVLLMLLRGKKNIKSYAFIAVVAVILIFIVFITDFKSTDDYYSDTADGKNVIGSVTLSISCDIIGESDMPDHIPFSGIILTPTSFDLREGDSVFDILTSAAKKIKLHIDYDGGGELSYIRAIENIYEYDYGELSGWVYRVNGEIPSVGCGAYYLKDGDIIEFIYSLSLGEDLK